MMLPAAGNMQENGNNLTRRAAAFLQERLPSGWAVEVEERVKDGENQTYLVFKGPDPGRSIEERLESETTDFARAFLKYIRESEQRIPRSGKRLAIARKTWDTRTYRNIRDRKSMNPIEPDGAPWVIIGEYVPTSLRDLLDKDRIDYIDLTGNIRIFMSTPGLVIHLLGEESDPRRTKRPRKIDLGKTAASRIAVCLISTSKLLTVREIGASTATDFSFVSRVITYLDSEGLVTRDPSGRLTSIDWETLLRRWSKDSPFGSRGHVRRYFDPYGLANIVQRIGMSNVAHTISGSFAAMRYAQVVDPRLLLVYVPTGSVELLVQIVGLAQDENHTNVLLVEGEHAIPERNDDPNDDFVFFASPIQVASDLLNSPGRGPEEAEAVIDWMKGNLDAWKQ